MRITKFFGIGLAVLVSIAPIGASAQRSGAKTPLKTVIARSDVRELPADQQIIQALNRLTFGAKPGDIPFYQASRFELVINLTTAKALGIAMPADLLAGADEVIE